LHGVKVEFTGLDVPNRYVFGCGMVKGYLRNIPGIYAEAGK
jgi:hypoxanthine phosphoribosyltransferase